MEEQQTTRAIIILFKTWFCFYQMLLIIVYTHSFFKVTSNRSETPLLLKHTIVFNKMYNHDVVNIQSSK